MRSLVRFCTIPKFAALSFAGVLSVFGPETASALGGPIGDLTVTVQERADGGVNFSMSGSTTYKETTSFSYTPRDHKGVKPAASATAPSWESIDLPEGLQFLVDGSPVPVSRLYFASGLWYLEVSSAGTSASVGTTISGTGMIEAPGVPYSHFEPETATVSDYVFDMTYRVIPFVPSPGPSNPRLRTPGSQRFSTVVGRSGRPRRVPIRNVGDATVTGIGVAIRGAGSRHFRSTRPGSRALAPGATTSYALVFRPRGAGRARASAVVTSTAPRVTTRLLGRGVRPSPFSPRIPGR